MSARMLAVVVAVAIAGCRGGEASPQATAPPETAEPDRCPEPAPVALPCPELGDVAEKNTTGSRGVDALLLDPVGFDALPGWAADDHAAAVVAFLASCERLDALAPDAPIGVTAYAGRARDWRPACQRARALAPGDRDGARRFFEREFRAYAARGKRGDTGTLTGYYVQALTGSRRRHGAYQWPIRERPDDLVEVFLSDFVPDGRGRRIWGQRDPDTGALRLYPTRSEIRARPLAEDDVLLWSDDPVGVAFAEIQGSGRVTLDTGEQVWIAFDGKNGRRFRGIGGIMYKLGEIKRGQGGVDGIRAWHRRKNNARRFPGILDLNDATVFFKLSGRPGAIGTQQAVLTPGRSIAIDRALVAFSTPIWVDTRAPPSPGARPGPFQRLLVAQDTGGSILGPLRGDIYFGAGSGAQAMAHRVNGPGKMWLLLPRRLVIPKVGSPP